MIIANLLYCRLIRALFLACGCFGFDLCLFSLALFGGSQVNLLLFGGSFGSIGKVFKEILKFVFGG